MQEIKQENTDEITIDFTKQINESYLRAIGYQIEYLLKSMFGGSFIPVRVSGTKEQVSAFARALGNEKKYIDIFNRFGLTDPRTLSSKHSLERAITGFERSTGIKWPFK